MSSPKRPKPRDYAKETRDTLEAQADLFPRFMELEMEYGPKMAQAQFDIAKQIAPQVVDMLGEISPELQQQDIETARMRREADVSDIETYGKRAVDALRATDPAQQALLDAMNEQVLGDLQKGGELDAYSERQIRQGKRADLGARGISPGSIRALGLEELITQEGRERRKGQRFASAAQMAGINKATGADAAMLITGRPSTVNAGMASGVFGQGASFNAGQLFNPESQYAGSLANQNLQTELGFNVAKSNMKNQLLGAGLGAAGNMLAPGFGQGGLFGCWVAREVFGETNPQWVQFFVWKENHGPTWFKNIYDKFGERFAAFISNKPRIKGLVKWMMEKAINGKV